MKGRKKMISNCFSKYLKKKKPIVKKLVETLGQDFEYVSCLGTDYEKNVLYAKEHRFKMQCCFGIKTGHDRRGLFGDHDSDTHRFVTRRRKRFPGSRQKTSRQVLCASSGTPAV